MSNYLERTVEIKGQLKAQRQELKAQQQSLKQLQAEQAEALREQQTSVGQIEARMQALEQELTELKSLLPVEERVKKSLDAIYEVGRRINTARQSILESVELLERMNEEINADWWLLNKDAKHPAVKLDSSYQGIAGKLPVVVRQSDGAVRVSSPYQGMDSVLIR